MGLINSLKNLFKEPRETKAERDIRLLNERFEKAQGEIGFLELESKVLDMEGKNLSLRSSNKHKFNTNENLKWSSTSGSNLKVNLKNNYSLSTQNVSPYTNWVTSPYRTSNPFTVDSRLNSLREESLFLCETSPNANAIITQCVSQVMQQDGITVEPSPLSPEGDLDPILAKELKRHWQFFGSNVVGTRVGENVDFKTFLSRILFNYFRDGEVFVEVVREYRFEENCYDFYLRTYTSNQLDPSYGTCGIQYDDDGFIESCRFILYDARGKPYYRTLSSDQLLALRNLRDVGSRRGMPILAPVIKYLKQYEQITDALVRTGLNQAKIVGIIEDNRPFEEINPNEIFDVTLEESRNGEMCIVELPPGRTYKSQGMGIGSITWESFRSNLIYQIAAGVGLSAELVSQSFNSSYSAARQSAINTDNVIRRHVDNIISSFVRPLYRCYISFLIDVGVITPTNRSNISRLLLANYQVAKRPSIDPVKDAKATTTLLQAGLISPQNALKQHGSGINDYINDLSQAMNEFERIGADDLLPHFLGANKYGGLDTSQTILGDNNDEKKDEDEDETQEKA